MKSSLIISGISCDNPNCDYADFTVQVEDYPNWINKPCPKCGENLLTQQAYDQVKSIMQLYETLKDVEFDEEADLIRIRIESGRDGIVNMEVSDLDE